MRTTYVIATAAAVCAAGLAADTRADDIEDIINQVTLAEFQDYLRVLTGVDPIPGNPPYYLQNRYSFGDDIHIAADWMIDLFTSWGLDASLHTYNWDYGPNVIGELAGVTNPDDIYIYCGHYDTHHAANQYLAPGCDDNGSGTAATILAARILSQYQFDATIRFIAFSGEEQWMVGSQEYAAAAAAAGENIIGAINLDMFLHPGFDNMPDPDYDLDIGGNNASQWLGQHLANMFTAYTPIDFEVHNNPDFVSDQWAFWQYGYDAVGLIENTPWEIWGGSNSSYHQLTDVITNPHFDWDFAVYTVRGSIAGLVDLAGLIASCPADINGDQTVDVLDLLDLLAAWGAAGGPEDVNGDGIVDVLDLLEVLGAWGPC